MELTANYSPSVRDATDAMFADLDRLAQNRRTNWRPKRAAIDNQADVTFWLIIGRSVAAFVLTAGIAAVVLLSILRPLAALRLSARAIAAGNLNARARVYGPEEVASLAHDFNRMTDALAVKTEEYVTTTNLTGDIIGKLDAQNRWTFLNDAACQFYGKPRETARYRRRSHSASGGLGVDRAGVAGGALTGKEPRNDLVNRVIRRWAPGSWNGTRTPSSTRGGHRLPDHGS
jgi:HAMP domain-containing protein